MLSQVTEDTVYTFALLLAVYLVGSAAGAAGYQRWLAERRDRDGPGDRVGQRLLVALAAACLAGTASLWAAERAKDWARHAFGAGVAAGVAAEAVPALFAFGPPTIVMGALFSHLAVARAHPASASGARWASTRWARRPRRRSSASSRCRRSGPRGAAADRPRVPGV